MLREAPEIPVRVPVHHPFEGRREHQEPSGPEKLRGRREEGERVPDVLERRGRNYRPVFPGGGQSSALRVVADLHRPERAPDIPRLRFDEPPYPGERLVVGQIRVRDAPEIDGRSEIPVALERLEDIGPFEVGHLGGYDTLLT